MAGERERLEALIAHLPAIADQTDGSILLAGMLAEEKRHFSGLSTEEADWLRGEIYVALARSPAPDIAAAQAREDLRTSSSPIVLAGVARVLRAIGVGPQWHVDIEEAAQRIRYKDIYPEFQLDPPATCCRPALTCLQELEATRAALQSGQEGGAVDQEAELLGPLPRALAVARLENQSGAKATLTELTATRPVLLALFYTRCMNPLKCSLTISRLAACAMADPTLGYVGMSYDPDFDTPHRLRSYGTARNFPFGDNAQLVRCTRGWSPFRKALEVRAGYGAATVNAHARELFLIEDDSRLWRLPPDWLAEPVRIRRIVQDPGKNLSAGLVTQIA